LSLLKEGIPFDTKTVMKRIRLLQYSCCWTTRSKEFLKHNFEVTRFEIKGSVTQNFVRYLFRT
jgi:hypothetical protein